MRHLAVSAAGVVAAATAAGDGSEGGDATKVSATMRAVCLALGCAVDGP